MAKKQKPKVGRVLTDKEMSRRYVGSGLASAITVMPEDSLWLPSRSLYLNYTMGGGIPWGKICEIFGGESSGKSLVAMDFGYSAQYFGGIVLWNDAEQAFDPGWAEQNGLDLDKIFIYNETSIEKISDWAADMAVTWRSKLKSNEPILIVTDSVAALDCEENINSEQYNAVAEMGNRAKAFYKYLRIRNQLFSELGITLIFINQLRSKVGATRWEDPDTTPAGNAMKFYAHQRLAFFRNKQIAEGKEERKIWLGNVVSVRLKKNKVAPPRPSFKTEIYFNAEYGRVGFDKYFNLVELLVKTKAVQKKGSRFYYRDEEIMNGRDNFQELLEDDADLRKKLLKKSKINTISATQRKLDRLADKGINRYPVVIKKTRGSSTEETEDDENE
jgi:recombination protein RecA